MKAVFYPMDVQLTQRNTCFNYPITETHLFLEIKGDNVYYNINVDKMFPMKQQTLLLFIDTFVKAGVINRLVSVLTDMQCINKTKDKQRIANINTLNKYKKAV